MRKRRMKVFVQVNTSGEKQKSGTDLASVSFYQRMHHFSFFSSCSHQLPFVKYVSSTVLLNLQSIELAQFIRTECPSLEFSGFMTIGSLEHSTSEIPNVDFERLFSVRKRFAFLQKSKALSTTFTISCRDLQATDSSEK